MNDKKKHIMEVSYRLFIENGFASTSIQDILNEAQIAKGTFYNYFKSKSECLINILDFVDQRAKIFRDELAIGKPKNDKDVFISQIIARMKLHREQNMLALYESALYSKDKEIRNFMCQMDLRSHQWISKRLIDLFGEQIKHLALDYTTILLGIIRQTIHVWNLGTTEEPDLESIVTHALKRIEHLVNGEASTFKKPFFPQDWITIEEDKEIMSAEELVQYISLKLSQLSSQMEQINFSSTIRKYVDFLHSEFSGEKPRLFLIESVHDSLKKRLIHTTYQKDFMEISGWIRRYLQCK